MTQNDFLQNVEVVTLGDIIYFIKFRIWDQKYRLYQKKVKKPYILNLLTKTIFFSKLRILQSCFKVLLKIGNHRFS